LVDPNLIRNLEPTNINPFLDFGVYFNFISTNVAYTIGPTMKSLQNRETQHENIVLQCMYLFFEYSKGSQNSNEKPMVGTITWEIKREGFERPKNTQPT